jgi:hypothetical protein
MRFLRFEEKRVWSWDLTKSKTKPISWETKPRAAGCETSLTGGRSNGRILFSFGNWIAVDQLLALQRFEIVDQPGLDHEVPVGSRLEPILQPETGDVLEVGGVVGDEGQVVDQRGGADHEVRGWNLDAAST